MISIIAGLSLGIAVSNHRSYVDSESTIREPDNGPAVTQVKKSTTLT